jgi:hypothetical protein
VNLKSTIPSTDKNKKQQENLEHFNILGSWPTNYARCTREIKSNIAMAKAALHKEKTFHQHNGFKFKEETGTTFGAQPCMVIVASSWLSILFIFHYIF